jgi:hypothetical protein
LQGLHRLPALAAQGLHGFFAAQGLHAFAAHGFFAAHGLQPGFAAQGFLAAQGLQARFAAHGLDWAAAIVAAPTRPALAIPSMTETGTTVVESILVRSFMAFLHSLLFHPALSAGIALVVLVVDGNQSRSRSNGGRFNPRQSTVTACDRDTQFRDDTPLLIR